MTSRSPQFTAATTEPEKEGGERGKDWVRLTVVVPRHIPIGTVFKQIPCECMHKGLRYLTHIVETHYRGLRWPCAVEHKVSATHSVAPHTPVHPIITQDLLINISFKPHPDNWASNTSSTTMNLFILSLLTTTLISSPSSHPNPLQRGLVMYTTHSVEQLVTETESSELDRCIIGEAPRRAPPTGV